MDPNQPAQTSPVQPTEQQPPSQPPVEPSHHSFFSKKIIILLAIFIIVLLASFGTYTALSSKSTPQPTPTPIVQLSPSPTPDAIPGWKTYENTTENFSFKYPQDWNLENKSDVTNGIAPSLSKQVVQGDKPALISILKFDVSEYNPEDIYNFAPFTSRTFTNSQNIYVLIAYSYQIAGAPTEKTQNEAIEVLNNIVSTFKFTDQTASPSAENTESLPKEECGCWDGINDTCLSQSACL